jgi:hypothetical protein
MMDMNEAITLFAKLSRKTKGANDTLVSPFADATCPGCRISFIDINRDGALSTFNYASIFL